MGHYHGAFPENVQKNKIRHVCHVCGKKKFEKFMFKYNEWHQGQWLCAGECGERFLGYEIYTKIKATGKFF